MDPLITDVTLDHLVKQKLDGSWSEVCTQVFISKLVLEYCTFIYSLIFKLF